MYAVQIFTTYSVAYFSTTFLNKKLKGIAGDETVKRSDQLLFELVQQPMKPRSDFKNYTINICRH